MYLTKSVVSKRNTNTKWQKIALDNEESILNGGCNVPTSHKTYKQDAFLYEKRFGILNIRNNLLIKI